MTLTEPARAVDLTRPSPDELDLAARERVATVMAAAAAPVTGPRRSRASRTVDCEDVPWTPFPMPGTSFTLLNIDEKSGAVSLLLYVSEGADAGLHLHAGAAEAYTIYGTWRYDGEGGPIGPNCYVYEPAGIIHLPQQESELLKFVVLHGPVVGYGPDGAIAGTITHDLLYDLVAANGAAGHLPPRTA